MLPRPSVKRFLLVTLGITGLYLGLNALWLALTPSLAALFDGADRSPGGQREAAAVADAVATRPTAACRRTSRLSPHIGWAFTSATAATSSAAWRCRPPEAQAQVREILAPRIQGHRAPGTGAGRRRGLVAARVERRRIRPRERPAGCGRARVGGAARSGDIPAPPASAAARHARRRGRGAGRHERRRELQNPMRHYIGRHATLAGVPAAAWEPVAREPPGATRRRSNWRPIRPRSPRWRRPSRSCTPLVASR